jgi:hypothetical protein
MSDVMARIMHQMYKGTTKESEIILVAGTFIETSGLIVGLAVLPFCTAAPIVVSSAFIAPPHVVVSITYPPDWSL